jgi:hypothetical protein
MEWPDRTPAQVLNHRALGHEYDVLDPPARGRRLVWHHRDTGETQLWFMDGHQLIRRATVLGEDGNPAFVGLPFEIVGVGEGYMRHRLVGVSLDLVRAEPWWPDPS